MGELKAYKAGRRDDSFYATVVFAETAGKARAEALHTDLCEDADFTEIIVRRCPALDSEYRGHTEMEWFDDEDRLALVQKAGYRCEYIEPDECKTCVAREDCEEYQTYLEELAEEAQGESEEKE